MSGAAALISGCLGLARFIGTWVQVAQGEDTAQSWVLAPGPTVTQLFFALVGVGCALAVVLPREGRRPAPVGILLVTVLVAGFAMNDAAYQIISSLYYR